MIGLTRQTVRFREQNGGKEHKIQVFKDGSKNEHGVRAGIAIYIQNKLTHQMKHKLHDRCSNNQAEEMEIFKALQAIETIKTNNNTPRIRMIHTDSRITLESLKNRQNRNQLIEGTEKR
jgi:ribonuclease HI